nr:YjbH domain-containing protein [Parachlamydiaceae bacterium]
PKGRVKKSPINVGVKYRLWEHFDVTISYIRGERLAFSASTFYNFGYTKGFLPKIDDPLPYRAPVNIESLGPFRPEDTLAQELLTAYEEQGLKILDIFFTDHPNCQKSLRIHVLNESFRLECKLRERLNHLLAYLMPVNIEEVTIVIFSEGFPIQEYVFRMEFVRRFADQEIGPHELQLLSPMKEVSYPPLSLSTTLFSRPRNLFNFELAPRIYTFFGSSTGKFKYNFGLSASINGFLPKDIYYNIITGYSLLETVRSCNDFDRLNPSQLINVRTDIIRYFQTHGLTLDEAYLQKTWTLGKGWYARLSAGYFEVEYGGAATELLYYPIKGCWAIGVEGAILKKRNYSGLGFTNRVRKLEGFKPTYHKFLGSQYFLNVYYDWKPAHLDFKISAGKFLANDWGVRYEMSRYFPSGLRLTLWYTCTNGRDRVNGETYFDKGIGFSMPFDIFYTHSERTSWNYGISAWLRDVGVQASTGLNLYELIYDQRQ